MSVVLGLGDGTLITYTLDQISSEPVEFTLSSRRKIPIGTTPLSLSGFYNANTYCIFASCDRPTIIYKSYEKLLFSVVNTADVYKMTSFHSELFPQSLCLISNQGFTIGTIDSIQKVHIRTIPIDGHPRKISHDSKYGIYGVIIEKTEIFEYGEETKSFLVFYDDTSMEVIYDYPLQSLEMGMCITSTRLSSHVSPDGRTDPDGLEDIYEGRDYFVVGTAYCIDSEDQQDNGRLLLFEIDFKNLSKRVIFTTEKETKSAVYSLCSCAGGKVAACIGSKVIVVSVSLFVVLVC